MKKKKLHEADKLQYTSERIDQFIPEAQNTYDKLMRIAQSFVGKIGDITIQDILANPNQIDDLLKKSTEAAKIASTAHEKYFDIVDAFDYMDSPKNVKTLDKIVTDLDYIQMDLKDIRDVVNSLKEAADYFAKLTINQEK
jgi:hypothetical protein